MIRQGMLERMPKVVTLGLIVLGLVLLLVKLAPAQQPLFPWEFFKAAPQGFGDRHNSMAWSMQWWKGRLYVGTIRSYGCFERAIQAVYFPWMTYPPMDPEMECAPTPQDLPLQAEIWCWTPEIDTWERVFQSPNDVEIPGYPGKYVARDIGFRDMIIFTEPDGTEALYVAGFCSRDFNPGVPIPRILRSTDGVTFEPIPQDPGTFLGDLDVLEGLLISGFNRMAVYNGRLYVTAGGAYGHGVLLEATNPADGNNSFRRVSPPGMAITGLIPFNGFFYVATGANPLPGSPPYEVLKTDAMGTPPYNFVPVVTDGGFRWPHPSTTIAHMHVYGGRLWAGTNRPTEMIRINPDDTWDLLVGEPRMTPDGKKYPLSTMGDGFDWYFNIHIHQLQDHDGWLYLATNDQSNQIPFKLNPWLTTLTESQYGFDVYRTSDGYYFYPITTRGFEEKSYDFTGRVFASTPVGLFLGTGNNNYGLHIWRGIHAGCYSVGPPERLEVESKDGKTVLSWEGSPDATNYLIFKSDCHSKFEFELIGATDQLYFLDSKAVDLNRRHYYVAAENSEGYLSANSNMVRAPSLSPPVTFKSLKKNLSTWEAPIGLKLKLSWARYLVKRDKLDEALSELELLKEMVTDDPTLLSPWRAEDLKILIDKLIRRIELVQLGVLANRHLLW